MVLNCFHGSIRNTTKTSDTEWYVDRYRPSMRMPEFGHHSPRTMTETWPRYPALTVRCRTARLGTTGVGGPVRHPRRCSLTRTAAIRSRTFGAIPQARYAVRRPSTARGTSDSTAAARGMLGPRLGRPVWFNGSHTASAALRWRWSSHGGIASHVRHGTVAPNGWAAPPSVVGSRLLSAHRSGRCYAGNTGPPGRSPPR